MYLGIKSKSTCQMRGLSRTYKNQTIVVAPYAPYSFDNHSLISGSPLLGGCLYLSSFAGLPINGL